MPARMLSVDPGVSGGWAVWEAGRIHPTSTGVWNAPHGHWLDKVTLASGILQRAIREASPVIIWCEWPSLHESTEAGMKSARTGDLIKLAASVGTVIELARSYGCAFKPFPVNEWKGEMSKDSVNHRISRILGRDNCTSFRSHAWDAVGIGLYAKGYFKP